MKPTRHLILLSALGAASLLLASAPASATKADRLKPWITTSNQPGEIDVANGRTVFNGDVIISQGTMQLRAEKVAVRETPDGYYQANASGDAGKQVSFREARDLPGEFIDGAADQIEYDTKGDIVRFVGNAVVRQLNGTLVTREVKGATIVFNKRTEVFTLEGGSSSPNRPAAPA